MTCSGRSMPHFWHTSSGPMMSKPPPIVRGLNIFTCAVTS